MATKPWDIHTASEESLVRLCEEAKKENGSIRTGSTSVVKLSAEIAVKYGHGVEASEAATQESAHRNADPTIVHVPRVYRFFQTNDPTWHRPRGYLFMEYVSGQTLKELDLDANPDVVSRVARIIEHFGHIQGDKIPGPVDEGEPQGYLRGEYGANATFGCIADMETWINKCLSLQDKSINLTSDPLVLCHMDFCRRTLFSMDWICVYWLWMA